MTNIYTADFLARYEVKHESWGTTAYPNAKQLRDSHARQLRKEGWAVRCFTYDYTDLGRFILYSLEAQKERGKQ